MKKERTKKGIKKYAAFAAAVFGVMIGLLCTMADKDLPEIDAFEKGFAHGFPGSFSANAIIEALFWQFFPAGIIYLFAYSYLCVPISAVIVGIRSVFSGYLAVNVYRIYFTKERSLFLYLIFLLCEAAVIGFYLSLARLSRCFFSSYSKGKSRKKVMRFTGDFLFFEGLILVFYLLRGCIVALMGC